MVGVQAQLSSGELEQQLGEALARVKQEVTIAAEPDIGSVGVTTLTAAAA